MKKIISSILVVMILLSLALTAIADSFAQPCYFQGCELIADKIQDKGLTDIETEKHTYGGFLGIGQKTCIISTQYVIYEIYCDAGHLNEVRRVVFAQSHSSCGQ